MSSYAIRDLPVGIEAIGTRREAHALGATMVPADRYWGAVTQRSLRTGGIAADQLPDRFHRCYGIAKKAAAAANGQAGRLPLWKVEAVCRAADDLIAGRLADHFRLTVRQAGSGHETDTNVNEVLANRAIQLLGGRIGSRIPIDPDRDVNMGQSVTAMFTTSLQIATVLELEEILVPPTAALARVFDRTGWPGFARRLRGALARIDAAEEDLHEVAANDADEASGMSGPDWLAMAALIVSETKRPFIAPREGVTHPGSLDAVVGAMAAVKGLAVAMLDITGLLAAVDRPPSAQASLEAMAMVCINVMGLDQVVAIAGSRGNAAPRALRPIIVVSVLNAVRTLGLACAPLRRIFTPLART